MTNETPSTVTPDGSPSPAAPTEATGPAALPPIPRRLQAGQSGPYNPFGGGTVPDKAVQSLLLQVMQSQKQTVTKFHLLVVPDGEWPRTEEFETVQLLVTRLKELQGEACHAFAYMGTRLPVTAGPHPHLKTPYGDLPLFDLAPAAEISDGWMGAAAAPRASFADLPAPGALNLDEEDTPAADDLED